MKKQKDNMYEEKLQFLQLLAEQYPSQNAACTEIINLSAILNLPKGTEHFVSDIHGEYDAFDYVMRNASGVIWEYIEELYGASIREIEKRQLNLLICYPERMLEKAMNEEKDIGDFYRISLIRMVRVCKRASSKHTRSKVRKSMPKEFTYILEELLHEDSDRMHKQEYYNQIIDRIIGLGRADDVIESLAALIRRLAIDHLHVIGDIFDRGDGAELIMEDLCNYHSVDVQWGNHDIVWMGAASGSFACICNVIRIAARYNNLQTLEDGYGINLVPLATFAMETYKDDPCDCFKLNLTEQQLEKMSEKEVKLLTKMHKAISVIQFKVEGDVIKRNPSFEMDDILLLDKINYDEGTIQIGGKTYQLKDKNFPTIDPKDPYALTSEELDVMDKLEHRFLNCEKIQKHIRFLFNKGGMYKVHNGNLLYHGCIPMSPDGELKSVPYGGVPMKGKALLDALERACRQGYALREEEPTETKVRGFDIMWYLWCGADSPLYGKNKMATFERYFIEETETHKEEKNPYFDFRDNREVCVKILENFGLTNENSCIVNGHVPVEIKKGESPIKAGGKLLNIDGGFAKAYQKVTGIAGYTLTYNSQGMALTSHDPFTSVEDILNSDHFEFTPRKYISRNESRIKVINTDNGKQVLKKIESLQMLVEAYREGLIKEKD